MEVTASKKVQKMATSIFTELAQKKREAMNKGTDVIDLSVGSPGHAAARLCSGYACKV